MSCTRRGRDSFPSAAVLLTCINLIRYLEFNEKFYTLIMTLRLAFWRVVRCIISVLPLFFGYALAGVVLFAPYSDRVRSPFSSPSFFTLRNRFLQFSNFDTTSITLFSLLNGDEIHGMVPQAIPWRKNKNVFSFSHFNQQTFPLSILSVNSLSNVR